MGMPKDENSPIFSQKETNKLILLFNLFTPPHHESGRNDSPKLYGGSKWQMVNIDPSNKEFLTKIAGIGHL
jgi:hypothetical protein